MELNKLSETGYELTFFFTFVIDGTCVISTICAIWRGGVVNLGQYIISRYIAVSSRVVFGRLG